MDNLAQSFDLQPKLVGERVILEPLRGDDFDRLYAVASDPLIWEQHPASDRYQEPVFREFFRDAMASGGAFLVRDAMTGEVIGSTRYLKLKPEQSEIEIGYTFLARSHWGGLWNGEMKRLMLRHAFQFVDRVVFWIGIDNQRSRTAVERIGAKFAGILPDANGVDRAVYAIKKEDFGGIA